MYLKDNVVYQLMNTSWLILTFIFLSPGFNDIKNCSVKLEASIFLLLYKNVC